MEAGLSYHLVRLVRAYCGRRGREEALAACSQHKVKPRPDPVIAAFGSETSTDSDLKDLGEHRISIIESGVADGVRIVFDNQEENLSQMVDASLNAIGSTCCDIEKFHISTLAFLSGCFWSSWMLNLSSMAERSLIVLNQSFHRSHWRHDKWLGANLGGWFLLEPGPASPLFEDCQEMLKSRGEEKASCGCEWSLCSCLDKVEKGVKSEVLRKHRKNHFDASTFKKIADHGLNAVRIPFGYWIVTGPTNADVYDGPALDQLDEAVKMARTCNLQVVLDLHGNPGGENGLRPCGREKQDWTWKEWRQEEALECLRQVVVRYRGFDNVTGIQVCNEPSPAIPSNVLCDFYEESIRVVREAGMSPHDVCIILPIFTQWRIREISRLWLERGNIHRYDNVAWDIHFYHDFHSAWSLLSHEQHVAVLQDEARELTHLHAAMVGEWSASRPGPYPEEEVKDFVMQQVLAYNHSSHGWFFWNWHDYSFYDKWDMENGVIGNGRLPRSLSELKSQSAQRFLSLQDL
uniref:glucan 1,3-beta-glucosidase n=1 Tax=Guillardia theta TaxID=55529 RepID=A0A7S4UFH4_GUITH|mmetsp:Transcript_46481/g.145748  ORF Transcript_46481/g.145748 Transcript_46481/m.145748 type:complete len:518 (+) Transcript_46481:121-1674(+)